MKTTVLVLGAGASVAVGYPVGAELRDRLLRLPEHEFRTEVKAAGLLDVENELYSFLDAFGHSQMNSIDAFLARRPEFTQIGKRAIALVLLRCESSDSLFRSKHPDHWYRYLFNALAAESWDALDFSNLQIITFNYDRSLEQYLLVALTSAYGRGHAEVIPKLRSLSIIHIYGTLGAPLPDQSGYLPYNGGVTQRSVVAAAEMIKVIPEGRTDDDVVAMARAQLVAASKIAFLGFGFDLTNLNRLDSEETCRSHITRANGSIVRRRVVASCLGMTHAELMRAIDLTAGNDGTAQAVTNGMRLPGDGAFIMSDCLTVLRSTLIL